MLWGEFLDCWCFECEMQVMYLIGDFVMVNGVVDEVILILVSRFRLLLQKVVVFLQESIFGYLSSSVLKVELEVEEDVFMLFSKYIEGLGKFLVSRCVIKGLMNLGNICFFNLVMQNLVGVSMF